jgi:ABC-type branched-subunit amino acid transport system permease subunit
MLDFYMGLPAWLSGVAVIGACVVICVGGHLLVRAIIPRHVEKQETELAVALMGVVAAFIGIMLAFAAVQVWDDYNQADHAVAQEAASIAQLYRDLTVYGDEAGPSRVAVKTYVRAVLEDEWPRLSHGQSGPKAAAALIQLFNQVGQIRPETNRQTVIYGEAFKKLNEVVGYRRARLITARAELPGLFWIVVVAGSAVMVAFTFAFPATRTNSLIIAGLAVSLGLIFMFILDVNRPFAGVYSVDSKELSDLLPLFDKISGPAL